MESRVGGMDDLLLAKLVQLAGPAAVSTDLGRRRLHSQDIWSVAKDTVVAVVTPKSLEDLALIVSAASDAGYAIAPRGAGMSYTSAYIPQGDRTVSLDMAAMNRVLKVDTVNMTVTVEAGCTWSDLDAALAPHGVRTVLGPDVRVDVNGGGRAFAVERHVWRRPLWDVQRERGGAHGGAGRWPHSAHGRPR